MSAVTPLDLARYAERAYGPPFDLSVGGCEIKFFDIARPGEPWSAHVIAIQGTTKDGDDIKTDLKGWWKNDPDLGRCHAGFLSGVRSTWPALSIHIKSRVDSGQPVYITAHSKGASEAILTAALATLAGYPIAGVVGLAPARAGFSRLGVILAAVPQIYYRNGRDAVPTHPWPLWGYRHPRPLTLIGDNEIRLPTMAELHQPIPRRWIDHQVKLYVDEIERLAAAGDWRATWLAASAAGVEIDPITAAVVKPV